MRTSRWEYMVLDVGVAGFFTAVRLDGDALTAKLNELGREGWDVAGLTDMTVTDGRTREIVIVLKRPMD